MARILQNYVLRETAQTWFVTTLVLLVILFAVHPGHKSSPYGMLVLEGFVFGLLIASLWAGRVQIFLEFDYTTTAPEVMLLQAGYAIPVVEMTCLGFLVLIAVFTIVTWFKVIKFEPSPKVNSHFNDEENKENEVSEN